MITNSDKTIIITGVTGQMGSWLSDSWLNMGYNVVGTVRRLSVPNHTNITHITNKNFILEPMDLCDTCSIDTLVKKYKPQYFINCAANSFVGCSWTMPEHHILTNTVGVLKQLEAIRNYSPYTKYLNFGSSEEFGDVITPQQNEQHPARARSMYAVSKIAARQTVKVYRETYGLYALQCWCFNYESERRGVEFISRKITNGVARIHHSLKKGLQFEPIKVGNIYALRDWSHALDFVDGIFRMLNQESYNNTLLIKFNKEAITLNNELQLRWLSKEIKEYVFASGNQHTVKEFIEQAFLIAGIEGYWTGVGEQEKFKHKTTNKTLVEISSEFYRPNDVNTLCGDSSKARAELRWMPKISFNELVERMVQNDIKLSSGN